MSFQPLTSFRLFALLLIVLIGKVTLGVVIGYRDYLPPNFQSVFLLGREPYFWDGYHVAFYTHLASGPAALLLGMVLISDRFRRTFPRWHRRLGRVQAVNVLLLVVPSGWWMAWYAVTGNVAGAGLATLAIVTAVCMVLGWRAAVAYRFGAHRRWMTRTFLLLCSAVVIRIIGGAATVAGSDALWLYPLSCWLSWLVPLGVYELVRVAAGWTKHDFNLEG